MEEAILYSYRGKTLKYIMTESEEEEEESQANIQEAEIAGLIIAGKFFRLGKKTASSEKCRRCGECCLTVGRAIHASPEDIERWIEENREDILKHLKIRKEGSSLITDGTLEIGDTVGRCIFLRKAEKGYQCTIHETKPEVCEEYPMNVGGICKNNIDFR